MSGAPFQMAPTVFVSAVHCGMHALWGAAYHRLHRHVQFWNRPRASHCCSASVTYIVLLAWARAWVSPLLPFHIETWEASLPDVYNFGSSAQHKLLDIQGCSSSISEEYVFLSFSFRAPSWCLRAELGCRTSKFEHLMCEECTESFWW